MSPQLNVLEFGCQVLQRKQLGPTLLPLRQMLATRFTWTQLEWQVTSFAVEWNNLTKLLSVASVYFENKVDCWTLKQWQVHSWWMSLLKHLKGTYVGPIKSMKHESWRPLTFMSTWYLTSGEFNWWHIYHPPFTLFTLASLASLVTCHALFFTWQRRTQNIIQGSTSTTNWLSHQTLSPGEQILWITPVAY